ncbi:MAG: hypothetical protein JWR37_2418, partial [Mycobacterium sp.]|jgi:hypothetical protein|nr:hypothetical protein [Mycobacterium sp.]MDT5366492.1 hypothetical protein [Mycobacterium sp.]
MALNTDVNQMNTGAGQLENILQDVLSSLARYETMNQNLTGTGFIGDAAMMSMRTTGDVAQTGKQVSSRFEYCISTMRRSAAQYAQMNDANRAALGNVTSA